MFEAEQRDPRSQVPDSTEIAAGRETEPYMEILRRIGQIRQSSFEGWQKGAAIDIVLAEAGVEGGDLKWLTDNLHGIYGRDGKLNVVRLIETAMKVGVPFMLAAGFEGRIDGVVKRLQRMLEEAKSNKEYPKMAPIFWDIQEISSALRKIEKYPSMGSVISWRVGRLKSWGEGSDPGGGPVQRIDTDGTLANSLLRGVALLSAHYEKEREKDLDIIRKDIYDDEGNLNPKNLLLGAEEFLEKLKREFGDDELINKVIQNLQDLQRYAERAEENVLMFLKGFYGLNSRIGREGALSKAWKRLGKEHKVRPPDNTESYRWVALKLFQGLKERIRELSKRMGQVRDEELRGGLVNTATSAVLRRYVEIAAVLSYLQEE